MSQVHAKHRNERNSPQALKLLVGFYHGDREFRLERYGFEKLCEKSLFWLVLISDQMSQK